MGVISYLVNRKGAKEILYVEKNILQIIGIVGKVIELRFMLSVLILSVILICLDPLLRIAMKAGNAKNCRLRIKSCLQSWRHQTSFGENWSLGDKRMILH